MPDWRLNVLPIIYKKYILQEDLLIGDGLTSIELKKLNDLHYNFSFICEKLSRYKIPETLDHCDFHDNNILIQSKTKRVTIIDLGETVITHPFFSLITCLRNFRFRYSLKETDEAYLNLKELSLNCDIYKNETKENIAEAFLLANQLWPVYESLGQYRLMTSCDPAQFKSLNRHGRLAVGLKGFIETFSGK